MSNVIQLFIIWIGGVLYYVYMYIPKNVSMRRNCDTGSSINWSPFTTKSCSRENTSSHRCICRWYMDIVNGRYVSLTVPFGSMANSSNVLCGWTYVCVCVRVIQFGDFVYSVTFVGYFFFFWRYDFIEIKAISYICVWSSIWTGVSLIRFYWIFRWFSRISQNVYRRKIECNEWFPISKGDKIIWLFIMRLRYVLNERCQFQLNYQMTEKPDAIIRIPTKPRTN